MTKTSKLQLNQPDATAGSSGPHHAKIIAAAQHRARLDARKREALDVGRWMLDVLYRAEGADFPETRSIGAYTAASDKTSKNPQNCLDLFSRSL